MKNKLPVLGLLTLIGLHPMLPAKADPAYSVMPLDAYFNPVGINNYEQIAGTSLGAHSPTGDIRGYALLYSNGTATDLGGLGGPAGYRQSANESTATGINDSGQVVGWAPDQSGSQRAFLYSNGNMTDLGSFNGVTSYAYGINNNGQVVGSSSVGSGGMHAFLFSDGHMMDLGIPSDYSTAYGINSNGQIVGSFGNSWHAFLYSDGNTTDLGTLGGQYSEALAINNVGQVVGDSWAADGSIHAFLYSGGDMIDIGPGHATGINDKGQVVGWYADASYGQHAFLYSDGKRTNLDDLINPDSGLTIAYAGGINNRGQIAINGYAYTYGGAMLLTPVPEPDVYATMLAGLGLVGVAARLRLLRRSTVSR